MIKNMKAKITTLEKEKKDLRDQFNKLAANQCQEEFADVRKCVAQSGLDFDCSYSAGLCTWWIRGRGQGLQWKPRPSRTNTLSSTSLVDLDYLVLLLKLLHST